MIIGLYDIVFHGADARDAQIKIKIIHCLCCTGMIFGLHGVVFHGADPRDAQKCVALQNSVKCERNYQIRSLQKSLRVLKNDVWGIV